MPIPLAVVIVRVAEAYLVLGLLFALWFAFVGVRRLDPVATRGTIGFRLLIVPGAMLLWPWLATRTLRAPRSPRTGDAP